MEIFTSITFWVILVIIIVILGIIGYLAEGTIFTNKNKTVKKEENKEQENISTWEKDTPTEAELRQEKVYQTADKSWNEIPKVENTVTIPEDNTGNETIDFAMPEFSTPKVSEPKTDAVFTNTTPEVTLEPVKEINTEVNNVNKVSEPKTDAVFTSTTPEVTLEPVKEINTEANNVNKVPTESLIPEVKEPQTNQSNEADIWKS